MIIAQNEEAVKQGVSVLKDRFACCTALKTEALKRVIEKYKFEALLVGIRRDEHAIRAKEKYSSMRNSEFQWDYQNQSMELWAEYYKTFGN